MSQPYVNSLELKVSNTEDNTFSRDETRGNMCNCDKIFKVLGEIVDYS